MKKLIFIIIFLFSAFVSFCQFPNNQSVSNAQTIYHIKGAAKGDVSLMLPVVDTLNNPATPYPGALTVRPQDTIGHAIFPIYQSNGTYWSKVSSSMFILGLGVDSVTLYNGVLCQWQGGIQTCYFLDPSVGDSDSLALSADSLWIYHYRNGALRGDSIFLLHTYLNVAPPHFSITYNYGNDPYSILLKAEQLIDTTWVTADSLYLITRYANGRFDSTTWIGDGGSGGGGSGGGTSIYETATASGSDNFTFTSVPTSGSNFIIFVNGAKIRQTTDYTWSGNVITITGIITGDVIEYQRIQ